MVCIAHVWLVVSWFLDQGVWLAGPSARLSRATLLASSADLVWYRDVFVGPFWSVVAEPRKLSTSCFSHNLLPIRCCQATTSILRGRFSTMFHSMHTSWVVCYRLIVAFYVSYAWSKMAFICKLCNGGLLHSVIQISFCLLCDVRLVKGGFFCSVILVEFWGWTRTPLCDG